MKTIIEWHLTEQGWQRRQVDAETADPPPDRVITYHCIHSHERDSPAHTTKVSLAWQAHDGPRYHHLVARYGPFPYFQ
jgi:hypothetical protein